jgi:predicted dehydrogenase/threonine dehydrogenase-like Zn-dependent dehydrogenase
MRQIFANKGKIIVEEVPEPICCDNGVLVANSYSLISSGTETASLKRGSENLITLALKNPELRKMGMNMIKSQGLSRALEIAKTKMSKPNPLGYSSAGVVVAVGKNVREFSIGDRVACGGAGYATHSEYVFVPKNLVAKMPDNVSFEEATFATVGSIALHGIRRSGVVLGDNVAVIGLGLIGLLTAQMLKVAGCNVVGIDIDDKKVNLAKSFKIDKSVTVKNAFKEVYKLTDGIGADAVIITAAAKTNDPLELAISLCRKRGKVVVVGDVRMEIQREPFYKKELELLISTSYGPGRYDPSYEEKGLDYPISYVRWTENRNMKAFLEMISKKQINVKSLISKIFKIKDAEKAYEELLNKNVIGILFEYKEKEESVKKIIVSPAIRKNKALNIAVIGTGLFASSFHLPNLSKMEDYNIRAIVTSSPFESKKVAEKYNARYSTTDYREVLKDKNVDILLIATRHNLHAQIAMEAAKAGKDVFSEKPMAMNEKELNKLTNILRKTKVNYMVGFNRRFSPLSIKAKEALDKKEGPLIINYIVNAGELPSDSWVYDSEEGGGRIIGECCHFFDLFNFFINSKVAEIDVKSIKANKENIKPEDNFIAVLKYEDGSIANLTYTSIGSKDMTKEKIEIFRDGSVVVIDDWKNLNFFGFKESNIKLSKQDKGHFEELVEFAKAIKGEKAQKLTLDECIAATKTSFDAVKKLKNIK